MEGTGTERLAQALAALPDVAGMPDHTRFERLAAATLFRWLDEPTVHDLTLRGASEAPHQIDVVVGDDRQRALVECKHYARKIDIPIVRNFFGAVEDIGCDLAAIVTTVGYSKNASTYAKAKGIDLLLLRGTTEADMENRVQEVRIDITMIGAHLRGVRVEQPPAGDGLPHERQIRMRTDDPTLEFEFASGRRESFEARFHRHYGHVTDGPDGLQEVRDEFEGETFLHIDGERLVVSRVIWDFAVGRSTTTTSTRWEPLVTLLDEDGQVLKILAEDHLTELRFERREDEVAD